MKRFAWQTKHIPTGNIVSVALSNRGAQNDDDGVGVVWRLWMMVG